MSNKMYDTIVFIGRFQIVHNAHKVMFERAADLADNVLVIIGSADKPRTFKNPFTTDERKAMIEAATEELPANFDITQVYDITYNDIAWALQIQRTVTRYTERTWSDKGKRVAIIGHKKDESSFYLDMFPQWDLIKQGLIEPLNATQIRDLYFDVKVNMNFIKGVVPESTVTFLNNFRNENKEAYEQIIREKEFISLYKKQYEHLQYAPIFVTTDAVVIQSGHVLMIKRRSEPGKGLWAFPGGFVNAETDRSLVDAMLRELQEETGLKIPEPVLRGSITKQKTFDAIDRSERGRTITTAFKIELKNSESLPRVKGMDDAEKAKWIPVSEVRRDECFEDHYCILQDMLGIV